MVLVSSILLIPAYSAHSAEIELPKIESTCKTERISALLVPPIAPELALPNLGLPRVEDFRQLESLIAAKQWEAAFTEFQNSSEWVQSDMLRPLLIALVQANEVQRASRFLIQQFPAQSEMRAKGVGAIAAELTKRNQFQSAIESLKTIPQNSEYLSDAVIPVVEILATTNQIAAIAQLMPLFSNDDARLSFWYSATRKVAFQPEQAKQFAAMIEDAELRSHLIARMANFWLRKEGEAVLNGWKIANAIEDCSPRLSFFLDAFDRLKTTNLNPSARSLNELEALLNARDAASSYRRLDQRVSVARLNIEQGRKAQGARLLKQVTDLLKQEESYYSRGLTLLDVAKQYQQLGDKKIAIQILDAAVISADASAKPQSKVVNGISMPMLLPPTEMRDELLREIAKQYRSLNQPQKASAIEKRIPKRLRLSPPEIYQIPAPIPSIRIQPR
ncbi:MAG: hypothetical protein MUC48_14730 [Leptolyngbya sp. Prado105]|jgi:hypothetical protein|nr:hypothetical protein [Leptolyngbya sp. Prado105]